MQPDNIRSNHELAAWSGAHLFIGKWLSRRCMTESLLNLASGIVFFLFGLVALAFTSCLLAGIVGLIMLEGNALLSVFGVQFKMWRPVQFAILFLLFLALSVVHAYRTRWNSESAAKVDLNEGFSTVFSLGWEFMSAGPILLIMAIQDFQRYVRLARLDIPDVSGLLLWLYDQGGRARFAEISMAFPRLNLIRVLPQLRDLPGIHWWPAEGEISMTDTMQQIFAGLLGREPKHSAFFHRHFYERAEPKPPPVPEADAEIHAWYAALNLPLFAPLQQVKSRYRKLAKVYHPDAGTQKSDEQMKRINEAYHNIVRHSQKRAGLAV